MRLTNEQYLIFAGLFQLIIATTYTLICISNYSFDWLDFEFVKDLSNNEILKIRGGKKYDPDLTWGLAGFNGIMFIVNWVIWRENEIKKKPDFESETFGAGLAPFGFALLVYFMVDYRNDLALGITGSYAFLNLALYISYEIRERRQAREGQNKTNGGVGFR